MIKYVRLSMFVTSIIRNGINNLVGAKIGPAQTMEFGAKREKWSNQSYRWRKLWTNQN